MGITLYRPGNTRKIKGIKCDMQTFDEHSYLHNLDLGWFYSPEECYPEIQGVEELPAVVKSIPPKKTRKKRAKKNKPEVR